jgi:hypothetical protein
MAVQPDISDTEEGLVGGSTKRSAMFQLLYLTFTAPRADPEAFAVHVAAENSGGQQERQPEVVPDCARRRADAGKRSHGRSPALVINEPQQVSFSTRTGGCERLHVRVRRQLRPSDDPAAHRFTSPRFLNQPEGSCSHVASSRRPVVEKHVTKGIDPKSQVSIVYGVRSRGQRQKPDAGEHDGALLSGDLHRTLREDLETWHQRAAELTHPRWQSFLINFGCDPAGWWS